MRFNIHETLVRGLINTQFPKWKALAIHPVPCNGWDNNSFRLGTELLIRMPSAEKYAAQVEKEHQWLPLLAPNLPLAIPRPVAMGKPIAEYPCKWSIYHWLEGNTVDSILPRINLDDVASALANFLKSFHAIDTKGAPLPGAHNFFRGSSLSIYDNEMRKAISLLKNKINVDLATEIWQTGLATRWEKPALWVHGDISTGNLLTQKGKLSAVIDFGMLGIGDPACDLMISFTLFNSRSQEIFRSALPFDKATWARARAWTLWKACIVAADITPTNASITKQSLQIINKVFANHIR